MKYRNLYSAKLVIALFPFSVATMSKQASSSLARRTYGVEMRFHWM